MARARAGCVLGTAAITAALSAGPAAADPAEEGRDAYRQACGRCHGQINESPAAAALSDARLLPAVMLPVGPNLTGVYGRPAGAVAGFRYSDAFRAATRGLVWDAEALDRWLADSQAFARGSYMFQKTPEPQRSRIIAYLARYGRAKE